MIFIDSREKKFDHIVADFQKRAIFYYVKKLNVGDYMSSNMPNVSIDRKANLDEIASNLSSGKGNYHRFLNEVKRAKSEGVRLIVLIEGTNCKTLEDVKAWHSKYSNIDGGWLFKQMQNLTFAYQVEWRFCRKCDTGRIIAELLKYGR